MILQPVKQYSSGSPHLTHKPLLPGPIPFPSSSHPLHYLAISSCSQSCLQIYLPAQLSSLREPTKSCWGAPAALCPALYREPETADLWEKVAMDALQPFPLKIVHVSSWTGEQELPYFCLSWFTKSSHQSTQQDFQWSLGQTRFFPLAIPRNIAGSEELLRSHSELSQTFHCGGN